jgi:hypothetical protein
VFHCSWTSAHTSKVLTGCSAFLFSGKQLVFLSLFAPEGDEEITVILQNIWIFTANNTMSHPIEWNV